MDNKNLQVLKFDSVNIPKPTEIKPPSDDKHVQWGVDNLYPLHILDFYNTVPTHQSVINMKSTFIIGDGLSKVGGDKLKFNVNAADTIDSFLKKITMDYLLFNAFAVEVIYNKLKQPIEYHFVPMHKLRMNESKSKFFFSKSWKDGKKPEVYNRWKQGNNDSKSKIFYFEGYTPSNSDVYSTPEYFALNKVLQAFVEVLDFNLNNLQNHFSVSTLITFFDKANIDENTKQSILNSLKKSYTGAQGHKMIVDFQDGGADSKAAEVKQLSVGDWHDAYQQLLTFINDQLYKGHTITTPSLFGDKTQGQLGGASEMREAYKIFKDTYVLGKRNELNSALNNLFTDFAETGGEVEIKDKDFFAADKPAEQPKQEQPDPSDPADKPEQQTKVNEEQSKFSKNVVELTEQDFEKISSWGTLGDEFESVMEMEEVFSSVDMERISLRFDDQQDISKYIIDNDIKEIEIAELRRLIRKDLGISVSVDELTSQLKALSKSGVINVDIAEGKASIKPSEEPARKVEVMYSYKVRAGKGEDVIPTTRAFCRKLVENNRFYTRMEVQRMAEIFGYDVFKYGGGFYRDPSTGEVTPYCRHRFVANTVSRKKRA